PTSKTGLELPTPIARSWPGGVRALNRRRVVCDQLLVSHFDVVPGDKQTVDLVTDADCELIGVWVDGLPVTLSESLLDESEEQGLLRRRLMLPVSRLSQAVEVVSGVRADTMNLKLPKMISSAIADVGETQVSSVVTWLPPGWQTAQRPASLVAHDQRSVWSSAWQTIDGHRQWQAWCVCRAIHASVGNLADRQELESADWLNRWVQRYHDLSHLAGRDFVPKEAASTRVSPAATETSADPDGMAKIARDALDRPDASTSAGDEPRSIGSLTQEVLPWELMDEYISLQCRRYLPGTAWKTTRENDAWVLAINAEASPAFVPAWVMLTDADAISLNQLRYPLVPFGEPFRSVFWRVLLLTLIATSCYLVGLWYRTEPKQMSADSNASKPDSGMGLHLGLLTLIDRPAFWLTLLALLSAALVPLVIALSFLGVAVTLAMPEIWRGLRHARGGRAHGSKQSGSLPKAMLLFVISVAGASSSPAGDRNERLPQTTDEPGRGVTVSTN
ncbi:MAG: hypothetical protein AAGD07_22005, partial [Planctomycetota bacterium]